MREYRQDGTRCASAARYAYGRGQEAKDAYGRGQVASEEHVQSINVVNEENQDGMGDDVCGQFSFQDDHKSLQDLRHLGGSVLDGP